jgi:hypothetical protein
MASMLPMQRVGHALDATAHPPGGCSLHAPDIRRSERLGRLTCGLNASATYNSVWGRHGVSMATLFAMDHWMDGYADLATPRFSPKATGAELGQLAETKMINCLSAGCGLSDSLRARPM